MKYLGKLLMLGAFLMMLLQSCVTVRKSHEHRHRHKHKHRLCMIQSVQTTNSFNYFFR